MGGEDGDGEAGDLWCCRRPGQREAAVSVRIEHEQYRLLSYECDGNVSMLFDYPDKIRDPSDPFTKKETADAYGYEMDVPWPTADEVRVEIRRGRALRVICEGDKTHKEELPRNSKMKVREARASLSADGVLTIEIPKRHGPRKWYEYADLVFMWFKTVRVGVSTSS